MYFQPAIRSAIQRLLISEAIYFSAAAVVVGMHFMERFKLYSVLASLHVEERIGIVMMRRPFQLHCILFKRGSEFFERNRQRKIEHIFRHHALEQYAVTGII